MSKEAPVAEGRVHEFITRSGADTVEVGRKLAALLKPPQLLLLRGELGTGKTTLVNRSLGFVGLMHYTLDDGRFPTGNQSRIQWEGLRRHHDRRRRPLARQRQPGRRLLRPAGKARRLAGPGPRGHDGAGPLAGPIEPLA